MQMPSTDAGQSAEDGGLVRTQASPAATPARPTTSPRAPTVRPRLERAATATTTAPDALRATRQCRTQRRTVVRVKDPAGGELAERACAAWAATAPAAAGRAHHEKVPSGVSTNQP